MYRQQRALQKIFCRYTVTYGPTASSHLAVRVLFLTDEIKDIENIIKHVFDVGYLLVGGEYD